MGWLLAAGERFAPRQRHAVNAPAQSSNPIAAAIRIFGKPDRLDSAGT